MTGRRIVDPVVAHALRKDGASMKEIAAAFGVSRSAVSHVLRRDLSEIAGCERKRAKRARQLAHANALSMAVNPRVDADEVPPTRLCRCGHVAYLHRQGPCRLVHGCDCRRFREQRAVVQFHPEHGWRTDGSLE